MVRKYRLIFSFLVMLFASVGCLMIVTSKCQAASNKNWESVYITVVNSGDSFLYYAKYGKLSIARNGNTIYVKNSSGEISKTIKPGYNVCSGVLTNGKDIIYQYGRNVYLWGSTKYKTKLFSLKTENDILVGRYGNNIFFGRCIEPDAYQLYKYNLNP